MEIGIIVGCDVNQEWLLPWFWRHYTKENSIPITFMNFGMSDEGVRWCQQRGTVLPINVITKDEMRSMARDLWEIAYGAATLQRLRDAWFKKPYAFLSSPFEVTLWLDLDCEVKTNIEPLFSLLPKDAEIGMVKEERLILFSPAGLNSYNTGVVLFRKKAPILSRFLEFSKLYRDEYLGDQEILSLAIEHDQPKMIQLPCIYNWDPKQGERSDAAIYHYMGQKGKEEIKQKMEHSTAN